MTNDTVVILYHSGTYGTYLHWALHSLTHDEPLISPLGENGNSHNFESPWVSTIETYRQFLQKNPASHVIMRMHPKTHRSHDLVTNIREVTAAAHRVIYVTPDEHTVLMCLHNFATKIWQDWWQQIVSRTGQQNIIYQQWLIDPATPMSDIPKWIQREFMSYFMMPMWLDLIGWYDSRNLDIPNLKTVTVSSILHDFPNLLQDIVPWMGKNWQKSVRQLQPIHGEMLQTQTYLGVDNACQNILDSVLQGQDMDWQPLHLVGESWLQWQLRNHGYEIKCDGLDIFPTNSICLKDMIYKP